MSPARSLTRLLFLAAIGHQITDALVDGGLFEAPRERLSRLHPRVEQYLRCRRCVAASVGVLLAATYRPNLLAGVGGAKPRPAREIAILAGDAALIALGSRAWEEALAWLRREGRREQTTIEAGGPDEEEQAMQPGISIRPPRYGISSH